MAACPTCTSKDLMRVVVNIGGGPLAFCHCRGCESRWWTDTAGGARVSLPQVLAKVAG